MRTFFGGLLLAVGLLIMGASGLCTGFFVLSMFSGPGATSDWGMFALPLMIGGVPFVVGLGIFFAGRQLLREAANHRDD